MNKIKIQSPATVANLSCGFDILGLCLDKPYDEIEIIKIDKKKVVIDIIDSPYSNIPSNPLENTGGVPALNIIKDLKLDFGFNIKINKGIPLCGGMGSSASTASGVVFAINKILDNKLTKKQMLKYALQGESVSVTNAHADNIAPCLLGGLTLIRDTKTLDIMNIPISDFYISLIHPHFHISTQEARDILPREIKLSSAITQWGNIGALVLGFASKDNNLIRRSMNDVIIEPFRSKLIKGFNEIKKKSIKLGAIGCSISGSGPTMFALCDNENIARSIINFSNSFYDEKNIGCDTYLSKVNNNGPKII
jgi:homoserine kinase